MIRRNNRNSIAENVILFLVAIGVFAIIGGFAGWWSGSKKYYLDSYDDGYDDVYMDGDYDDDRYDSDDDYAAGVDDAIDDDDEDW